MTVKDAKEDIERLSSEVRALNAVIREVEDLVKSRDPSKSSTLEQLTMEITRCSFQLEHLQNRLDPGKRRKTMSRLGLRALKWPFQSKDVNKIIEALEKSKTTISLALSVDQRWVTQHQVA